MLTVRATINIAGQTVPQIIPVVQGDTGRAILFTLADFTIPTGATANYYIQKPSGLAVYNAGTIDGNTVLVELTAQSIIEEGDNYLQIRILKDDDIVTSFDCILQVKPFRGIDATQSTGEMTIFDQAERAAAAQFQEDAEEIAAEVIESIPADYTTLSNDVSDLKQDLNYNKTATQGYILTATNSGHGSTWSPVGLPTDAQTAQAVTAWLNAHPEATTTVQDGSLTKEKFSSTLYNQVFPDPLNVLTLGIKNDGSEDISEIVNQYTQTNILYFPAGRYLVSSPIAVVNSIFGAGVGRNRNVNTETIFLADSNEANLTSVFELSDCSGNCELRSFGIVLSNDTKGMVGSWGSARRISVSNITIVNINTCGIDISADSSVSRGLFIDNCTMYGRSDTYRSSCGIKTRKINDARVTNVDIMGTCTGIDIDGSFYGSNIHVWMGHLSGSDGTNTDTNSLWSNGTKGIVCASIVTLDNVIIDSSICGFSCATGANVSCANLFWLDGSSYTLSRTCELMNGNGLLSIGTLQMIASSNLPGFKYLANNRLVSIDDIKVTSEISNNAYLTNQYFAGSMFQNHLFYYLGEVKGGGHGVIAAKLSAPRGTGYAILTLNDVGRVLCDIYVYSSGATITNIKKKSYQGAEVSIYLSAKNSDNTYDLIVDCGSNYSYVTVQASRTNSINILNPYFKTSGGSLYSFGNVSSVDGATLVSEIT